MSNLQFPLRFLRQYAASLDADSVFDTESELLAYLNSPRRYPGQVVACVENGFVYVLNADSDAWINLSPQDSIKLADKATTAQAEAATDNEAWMTPERTKELVNANPPVFAMGVVTHGADNTVSRPSGFTQITWIGEVEPLNREVNDIWINNEE